LKNKPELKSNKKLKNVRESDMNSLLLKSTKRDSRKNVLLKRDAWKKILRENSWKSLLKMKDLSR
jgi:hypothetical protein